MIETIEFKGNVYPAFQATGNAARFCRAFAQELCKGMGFDIGCNRLEWALPGALAIDPSLPTSDQVQFNGKPFCDGLSLPDVKADYIHSSHCLEHLPNPWEALEHWHSRLNPGGVLFLYLPNMDDQVYWRPWHNKKHVHYLTPDIMTAYFTDNNAMWDNWTVTYTDLNSSFTCTAVKI